MKLKKDFYIRNNVLEIAKDLIGKVLVTHVDGIFTAGVITETEGYDGIRDRACHAFNGRRTPRTEIMYSEGGIAYIYLCYGIHALFNVVTNEKDTPDAVLIRAVSPVDGVEQMLRRRNKLKADKTLAGGPGTVSQSLGLRLNLNGTKLTGKNIWIEDRSIYIPENEIKITKRIGVEGAGEAAHYPYRFVIKNDYF
ncbi:MAG: DNA-3-methyladenine glycosylase [Bacteroidota bacterium]